MIQATHEVLDALRLEKHPEKTFIGRIGRGFDFLGYWFSPQGVAVAGKTVDRMAEKVLRLYEQGADDSRIGTYLRHWVWWVRTGVKLSRALVEEVQFVNSFVLLLTFYFLLVTFYSKSNGYA